MFRRILLIILLLVVILIGIGFLLPRHVLVVRTMNIKVAPETIYEQVDAFKNWKSWAPWIRSDSTLIMKFSGPEEGIGSAFTYQSSDPNVGNGKLIITNAIAYDSIVLEMDFLENGKATSKFVFIDSDSGTLVKWLLESDLGNNPISRWFGLFMDKMVGKDLENGLTNLKEVCITKSEKASPRAKEKLMPAQIILTIRDTCSTSTISSKLSQYYKKISQLIKSKKLILTGTPFAIYRESSPNCIDLEAGLPVNSQIESSAEIICRIVPAQRTIMTTYTGSGQHSESAYESIKRYIKDKNLFITGPFWEVYVTDPQLEPDSSKWQTEIYFPVK